MPPEPALSDRSRVERVKQDFAHFRKIFSVLRSEERSRLAETNFFQEFSATDQHEFARMGSDQKAIGPDGLTSDRSLHVSARFGMDAVSLQLRERQVHPEDERGD